MRGLPEFWVKGLGFRVQGFRVQRFRVQGLGFRGLGGPWFFFCKGLAPPWFGSPLADFLQVLAFSGSWFFAPRTKERNKQRTKERYKSGKKQRQNERRK